jgi:hypothetical protein
MIISALEVTFQEDAMWVALSDGRKLGVPLSWFPRLARASEDERRLVTISPGGLHWEALDEDISIAALLAGRGDQTITPPRAA